MARTIRSMRQRLVRIHKEVSRLVGDVSKYYPVGPMLSQQLRSAAREWELKGWGGADDTTADLLHELSDEAEELETELIQYGYSATFYAVVRQLRPQVGAWG